MQNNEDIQIQDFDWGDFVEKFFRMDISSLGNNAMEIGFEDDSVPSDLLIYALSRGSGILFNKALTSLNEEERVTMLKYFHCLGFDITYSIVQYPTEQRVEISFSKLWGTAVPHTPLA